jgi:hypothetical protein
MVEAAGTNLLKTSYFNVDTDASGVADNWDISGAPPVGAACSIETSPLYGNAQKVTLNGAAGNFFHVTQLVAVDINSIYTVSLFVKATSWTGNYIVVIGGDGGFAEDSIRWDVDLGMTTPYTSDWIKVSKSITTTHTQTSLYVRPCRETTGTGTGSEWVSCVQIEKSPYATSFIPTTTAALTRNAENADFYALTQGYNSGQFTFPTVNLGSTTGVSATATNGVLTLQGLKAAGNNENLTLDFETTANNIALNSPSSASLSSNIFIKFADAVGVTFGNYLGASDARIIWQTVGNDNLLFGTTCGSSDGSGYINIMETADINDVDRSPLATTTHPTLRIYSEDAGSATDYIEMYHDQTNGVIGLGTGVLNVIPATDATTNTVSEVMRLTHSGGAIAANFGTGLDFYLEDATAGTIQQASRIGTLWTDATDATRTSAITFSGVTSGGALTEWGRFYGAGTGTGGVLDIPITGIGSNVVTGLFLENNTITTGGGTNDNSPSLVLRAKYFSTTDKYVDWAITNKAVAAGSRGDLYFYYRKNTSTYTKFPVNFTGDGYAECKPGTDIGEGEVNGWAFLTDYAATVGGDENSLMMTFMGRGWKTDATAASQPMTVAIWNAPEQGAASPIGVLKFSYGTNSSSPTESNELYRLEWGDRLGAIFNDRSINGYVFRVEGDTDVNLINANAVADKVGIGTAAPTGKFQVEGGDVYLNLDTTIADASSGYAFYIYRKATEGTDYLKTYVTDDGNPFLLSSGDIRFHTVSGTDFIRCLRNTTIGASWVAESPTLDMYGVITAASGQKYIRWQVEDTNDTFALTRQDTNIKGFAIGNSTGMPTIFVPSTTQAITAVGNTILANSTMIVLNPDADYTMTSAPTIADGLPGQIVYITCPAAEANVVTVQDQGTLANSNLQLGAASRGVSGDDVLCLLFDGSNWIEVSYANN